MIRHALDLSTSHVSPAARQWLEGVCYANAIGSAAAFANVGATFYGWTLYAPTAEECETLGLHADLHSIAAVARANECDWIILDADGEIMDGLPQFMELDDDDGLTDEEKAALALVDTAIQGAVVDDAGIADELAEPGELSDDAMLYGQGVSTPVNLEEWKEVEIESPQRIKGVITPPHIIIAEAIGDLPAGEYTLDVRHPIAADIAYGGSIDEYLAASAPMHPQVTDHSHSPTDRNFLLWVRDRLTLVYGENPNVDFIWKLEAIAMALPEGQMTPNMGSEHPDSPDYVASAEAIEELRGAVLAVRHYCHEPRDVLDRLRNAMDAI